MKQNTLEFCRAINTVMVNLCLEVQVSKIQNALKRKFRFFFFFLILMRINSTVKTQIMTVNSEGRTR